MAKFFKDIGVSEEAVQNISNGVKKVVNKVGTIVTSEIKKEPTVVVKKKTDSDLTLEKQNMNMDAEKNKELTVENESLKKDKSVLSENVEKLKQENEYNNVFKKSCS